MKQLTENADEKLCNLMFFKNMSDSKGGISDLGLLLPDDSACSLKTLCLFSLGYSLATLQVLESWTYRLKCM